ncbi:hypothetical protein GCM10010358_63570 [Streptomyces minutiscleroticus]|uniref:Tetratricopeptide repeat protein n=1 Tax=Streptomyces minutiscleroticus TaxID=68238 RepID=A0A918NWV7_9ACTN|nr:tetratricopeptide repeat protein [Streptomyces minutiscleroticus]GGY00908.1 hypothetical protein GCM10010358_63570 [Streptomyces minutiscleroticus]
MTGTGRYYNLQEIGSVRALRTPAFELREVREDNLFAEHDRRLQELALGAPEAPAGPRTPLLLSPLVDASVEMSLDLGDDGEDLLADARTNIASGTYDVALELLDEYLHLVPGHQEARFLRAFCLFRLGGEHQTEALRILRPLRDENPAPELRDRVRELRGELRRRLTPLEITAYADTVGRDPAGALDRIGSYLELVPEEGTLSYLLALGLARVGDPEKALETAEKGAAEADTDVQNVAALARRLRLVLLTPVAEPAVRAFLSGSVRHARLLLAGVEPRWRDDPVLKDFDAYLADLGNAHRHGTAPPAPRLPDDRAENLYSLIAESETRYASELMQAGRLEEAEQVLAGLMSKIPGFRWLNFLYALCLYQLGRSPEQAAACAETARRDPTLTQAPELVKAIRGWQEAVAVNPAVEEYVSAMESVAGGASVERLTALRARLLALRARLPSLRRETRTEAGAQVVRQLDEAITDRLAEIADAVVVGDLFQDYERVMSAAGGGITSVAQADRLAASLDLLARRIKDARTKAGRGPSAREQLDGLASQVAARRAEADRVRTAVEVAGLVRRFNSLAEQRSGAPTAVQAGDFLRMRGELDGILREARRLRRGKGPLEPRDLRLLDDLIGAITKVLR